MKLIYKKCTNKACSMGGIVQIYKNKNRDTCPFCNENMYQLHNEEKINKELANYRYETDDFVMDNTHPKTLGNKLNEKLGLPIQGNCDDLEIDNSVELSEKEKTHRKMKRKAERKARKKNRRK